MQHEIQFAFRLKLFKTKNFLRFNLTKSILV